VLTSLRSSTLWRVPTAPQIFFGRGAELAEVVQMITANIGSRPARIAILGPGGYGKTTLARAVLTIKDIQEHFGNARYFVPCESVTSSGAFLTELGKTLGVLEGGTDALWFRIQATLTSKDSIVCFDNFESPWDQHVETKHSVEELLSRVTELPRVTVLVTMRGAERPARTQWTQPFLGPLETLSHDAAKEIWEAIAENYNDFSEKLIEAVDYVPLAVDLLSHLSQVMPPELLWEEWSSKRTKVVQTSKEHRLTDLEYSIQLSVNSGRMKANPSAKNMLGVLSMLPDGLHMKQLGKFKGMFVDLDIIPCLQTLLQCSLIKLIEERYQPHPIVRHFCLNEGVVLPVHKELLEEFYITLAVSASDSRSSSEVREEAVLEVNNIKAILLSLLESNYKDQTQLIYASTKFTTFCTHIGDFSEKVISQAVQFVQKNSGSIELLIMSFANWGELHYHGGDWEKAQEKLQEAERLCLSGPSIDSQIYGPVLEDLGDIYNHQNAFNDAEVCYQKALKCHQASNNILGQGNSCFSLGYLYSRQRKDDKASIFYQSAIQCHEMVDATLSLGNDYMGLGQIYTRQNRQIEAEATLQKALKFHMATNSFLSLGNDYTMLGELYMALNKLQDAMAACQKALEFYKAANSILGQGDVHRLLGEVYFSQGRMNEAESSFKMALELFTVERNAWSQGYTFGMLGKICMKRGQLHDAKRMFEKAIDLYGTGPDSAMTEKFIEHLNVVLKEIKESSAE
jgi:tetratricopeptide (TPR) repeat protein